TIKKIYGKKTKIFFIVGYDTIIRILDKKYYKNRKKSLDRLFNSCFIIVANRNDRTIEDIKDLFKKPENIHYKDKIYLLKLSSFTAKISSTLIRENVKKNKPINKYAPSEVVKFIKETGLYLDENNNKTNLKKVKLPSYKSRKEKMVHLFKSHLSDNLSS
ncbi:hypothetical protein DRQ09_10115, partial [candidate division KSB1 bacterium]